MDPRSMYRVTSEVFESVKAKRADWHRTHSQFSGSCTFLEYSEYPGGRTVLQEELRPDGETRFYSTILPAHVAEVTG